ncbi:MAG TPA: trigger factor [Patescibacteria group bacterium]
MATNSQIKKSKDKTFILTLTIPQSDITAEYESHLKNIQKDFETKGFRKGKAPLEVVKANVSQPNLMEDILNHLLSHAYTDEIKNNDIKPIIEPRVKILNPPITLEKDWEVEFTGAEMPDLSLKPAYQEEIKKSSKSSPKTDTKEAQTAELDRIFDIVLKNSSVELPEILIEAGVDNRLSQLVDQTAQAGISVDQYLESKKMTLEQFKDSLKDDVRKEWILNLAINKIAADEKLEVSQDELKKQLETNPQLANNINLLYYLLQQQKVVSFLTKLATETAGK